MDSGISGSERLYSAVDEPPGSGTTKVLRILGTRGIPAAHGGFETFAQQLALHLVDRGWRVIVYCQEEGDGDIVHDSWRGVERIRIPVRPDGVKGTMIFDWKATRHAAGFRDLCLTLGYNTAVFCALLRLRGVRNLINMDGIEWSRSKWGLLAKTWLWFNEWCGIHLANHLIADHPEIQRHLRRHGFAGGITTIAYGGRNVTGGSEERVRALGLEPGKYLSVIARLEPENSILEIVRGYSARKRGLTLAVVGNRTSEHSPFSTALRAAAGDEVRFLGAIYDRETIESLRFHSLAYIHGHQVGGTNPSLVEALGAGNAVIAHDNRFNRWVAGDQAARYFSCAESLSRCLDALLAAPESLDSMRKSSRLRFEEAFRLPHILQQYEALLLSQLPSEMIAAAAIKLSQQTLRDGVH